MKSLSHMQVKCVFELVLFLSSAIPRRALDEVRALHF